MPSYEYIEIGPSPSDEPCAQVGSPDYEFLARKECSRFRDLIRKHLGPEPEGAYLIIKANPHDFGSYYEVMCKYDPSVPAAVEYAFRCDNDAPTYWDSNIQDISDRSPSQSGPQSGKVLVWKEISHLIYQSKPAPDWVIYCLVLDTSWGYILQYAPPGGNREYWSYFDWDWNLYVAEGEAFKKYLEVAMDKLHLRSD